MKSGIQYIICVFLMIIITTAKAGIPVWSFTPLTPTKISVSAGQTATIQYKITNNSKKTHTLLMKTIPGITQTANGAGHCNIPFILTYQASCILNLEIKGSELTGNVHGGPEVCEQGNALQCYRPGLGDLLDITLVSPTSTTLQSSLSNLALSVNDTVLSPQLTGTPRKITITNSGTNTANNVTFNLSPALPAGTTINPASCGNIAPASSCVLTITPGSTPSAAPEDVSPAPVILSMGGTNTNMLTASINILTYGSVYQSGFVFSVDDTTPDTSSIGGKVAALADQNSITGIIWSSNGNGGLGNDVDYTDIPGIYLDSLSPCIGRYDGACNTEVIVSYYNANRASGGSAPTPLTYYAAGLCKAEIASYTDWYLPAICELGPASNGSGCAPGTANILDNLSSLVDSGCAGSTCIEGLHWSSTEDTVVPQFGSWTQSFASGGASFQVVGGKGQLLAVRCVRALTP